MGLYRKLVGVGCVALLVAACGGDSVSGSINVFNTPAQFTSPNTVSVPEDTAGVFYTATATDAFGNTSEFSEARLVADVARADLAASIELPPSAGRVGQEVTFTATVANRGPARATGARLAVTLPPDFAFVAAQSPRGPATFADGVVNAPIGGLLPDQAVTVTVRAVPRSAGVAAITAAASADHGGLFGGLKGLFAGLPPQAFAHALEKSHVSAAALG